MSAKLWNRGVSIFDPSASSKQLQGTIVLIWWLRVIKRYMCYKDSKFCQQIVFRFWIRFQEKKGYFCHVLTFKPLIYSFSSIVSENGRENSQSRSYWSQASDEVRKKDTSSFRHIRCLQNWKTMEKTENQVKIRTRADFFHLWWKTLSVSFNS
jgi:hypothetical protein